MSVFRIGRSGVINTCKRCEEKEHLQEEVKRGKTFEQWYYNLIERFDTVCKGNYELNEKIKELETETKEKDNYISKLKNIIVKHEIESYEETR